MTFSNTLFAWPFIESIMANAALLQSPDTAASAAQLVARATDLPNWWGFGAGLLAVSRGARLYFRPNVKVGRQPGSGTTRLPTPAPGSEHIETVAVFLALAGV